MSFDLPDETSTLYRYVRRFDRWLTKLRHTATSRQPMMGFQWILLTFLLVIPALAIIFFLIQCTHTRYVLLTGPAGSTTGPTASDHSQRARSDRAVPPLEYRAGF